MTLDKSFELLEISKRFVPALTQTFSRAATSFVEGVYPVYAHNAKGSHFTDVDGNEYLDYLLGLGPITLGYNYQAVNDAIINQLKNGILFSLPHPIELDLSELLCKIIPHAEMVKFEKSGSNVVTGAVRAARAITGRNKIAYCGSGGVWHDWQAAMVSRDGGVPQFNKDLIKIFDYNDVDGLEQLFDDNKNEIAAIVLEPTVYEKPSGDFLKKVREIADRNTSILILDEIVTGFRFDIQGCQKFFGIKGDFVCFGKGMANGMPLSAITGPSEHMKIFEKLWVSSTMNSETLSLAASLATLNEIKNKDCPAYCWKIGKKLFDGWNQIVENNNLDAKMIGYPIRMTMKCYDSKKSESIQLKALILQEMVKHGIFISPGPSFISYSHTLEDVELTLNTLDGVCKYINKESLNENYDALLEGNIPKTIWTMALKPVKKRTI